MSTPLSAAHSGPNRWQPHLQIDNDQPTLNRRRALVADDDADSREALAELLRWCGYDVQLASDGDQALVAAREYRPELIFLDIGMPCRDGYDVCRCLRRRPEFEHTRIIAVSGFSGETHDTRCSEAGFTAQMSKPIDPTAVEQLSAPGDGA